MPDSITKKGNHLSDFDPFDNVPADEPEAEAAEESVFDAPPADAPAPKKAAAKKAAAKPVVSSEEGKITITFKGTRGYADRWVVVHASDAQDGLNQINDPAFKELLDRSWKIAEYDGTRKSVGGNAKPASGGGGGAPAANGRPAGATQAPSWMPAPPAPDWVYKSAMKKDGSGVYHAWAPPRGQDGQWKFHNPPK